MSPHLKKYFRNLFLAELITGILQYPGNTVNPDVMQGPVRGCQIQGVPEVKGDGFYQITVPP